MRKFLWLLPCLFLNLQAAGQADELYVEDNLIAKYILKYSPINLLDLTTPGIQFALERRFNLKQAVQLEIGYLNDFNFQNIPENLQGYRIRGSYRHYFRGNNNKRNPFIEGVLMWKHSFRHSEEWVWRSNFQYQQRMDVTYQTLSGAMYCTYGAVINLNENWIFEWGGAAGLRYLIDTDNLPPDTSRTVNDFDFIFNDGIVFPSIYFIFKIGYVIQ